MTDEVNMDDTKNEQPTPTNARAKAYAKHCSEHPDACIYDGCREWAYGYADGYNAALAAPHPDAAKQASDVTVATAYQCGYDAALASRPLDAETREAVEVCDCGHGLDDHNQHDDDRNGCGAAHCYCTEFEVAQVLLSSVRPVWIPVSERLPDDYQKIWVQYGDGEIDDAIQQKNIVVTQDADSEVVAWMPIEQPAPFTPDSSKETADEHV